MIRTVIRYAAIAAVVGLGACDLAVSNPNQPETKRVLSSPTDVESLLGNYYKRWHSGMWASLSNVQGMANVQSFEDYSSLSNNCMGQRVGIPRATNDNSIGNGCAAEQARVYFYMAEVNRVASSILLTLNTAPFTLGSTNQDNRARSFAMFLRGVSLGYAAMFYDSAAVTDEKTDPVDPGKLAGYKDVALASMDALQKAIDFANTPGTGSAGFPLPSGWIPSSTSMTQAEFIKLIRTYRARIRAGIARTPAERAAIDWTAVIADAQNGITTDHDNITNTTTGPNNSWLNQFYAYGTWHQMAPFVIGMADNSGSYAQWIGTPLAQRGAGNTPFFMTTPDLRFPQGATRAAQQADFAITSCNAASTPCKRYFVNRNQGNDVFSGNGYGFSNYDHARFWSWRTNGDGTSQNGKLIFFTLTELNMLEAEGQIVKGNYAAAAALINKTRTKNGLPAITALDNTTPVPGGADCVPKVPVGPSYTTIACGNMMEALKYEKRIEEAYTGFAQWFVDMRGWGDLPEGTGYHWAVPYAELQSRGYSPAQVYSTGGGINSGSAVKGTYGW
ncbi:MAG: RagB/SusD family nutrient uptake outer membrane protein [bacterium]